MIKNNEPNKTHEELSKERVVAAITAAMVQSGTISLKSSKKKIMKMESEWKKKRINGLR